MNILKLLSIRTRLLTIIFGCSAALVCLGLSSYHYLGALSSAAGAQVGPEALEAGRKIYREALTVNLSLLAFFIVCGAGAGLLIGMSINSGACVSHACRPI